MLPIPIDYPQYHLSDFVDIPVNPMDIYPFPNETITALEKYKTLKKRFSHSKNPRESVIKYLFREEKRKSGKGLGVEKKIINKKITFD